MTKLFIYSNYSLKAKKDCQIAITKLSIYSKYSLKAKFTKIMPRSYYLVFASVHRRMGTHRVS